MNVARLNFSHGTHEEHLRKIKNIRQIANRMGQPVAILQDLGGPKIRVGLMKEDGEELKRGKEFYLTNQELIGDKTRATVTYSLLANEVKPGDKILLADGTIELKVLDSDSKNIRCQIVVGGMLTSHKGMNFPTGTILASTFTEKDHEDLLFGIYHGGDLGVETPIENIPNVQKKLIRKANALGKPVITATQMLRSMVDHTQPTRAEVTDVVNAIYDGRDAIMLSEETASGQFPVESV